MELRFHNQRHNFILFQVILAVPLLKSLAKNGDTIRARLYGKWPITAHLLLLQQQHFYPGDYQALFLVAMFSIIGMQTSDKRTNLVRC